MARLRSAPVAQTQPQPSPPKAQNKRQALREKTNISRGKAPVYEDDGNTENLVKTAKARKGRPKKSAHNEEDLVMAGGLGLGRTDSAEEPRSEAPMTTDELAKSDASPPTVKPNRRPPRMTRKPIHNEAQSKVLEGLKKRMEATARREAGRKDTLPAATESTTPSSDPLPTKPMAVQQSTSTAQERSEYSISPSPPPPGKLSSAKRSSLAQSGTPAVESSILALKNFKRRPRQPSMLQMVQQRTASARPSAVNLAANEDPSVFDFEVGGDDADEEDEDDFAPDAEGTPLHVSRAKRRASASAKKKPTTTQIAPIASRPAALPKKRKSDEADTSFSALDALRAKRHKSDAPGPATDDEPLATFERSMSAGRRSRDSSVRQATPQQQITSDVQVINSSPSSTPPTEPSSDRARTAVDDDYAVPSTEKEQDILQPSVEGPFDDHFEEDAPNGTMAEPASSSPSPDDPFAAEEQAEILAEPVTQVTQQSPVRKRKEPKKKAKPLSTATLQSLLPKRRQPPKARHRKTEYDFTSDEEDEDVTLDASHLEDDEDELGGRLRRQKKSTPAKGRKSTAAKAKNRATKATQQARKSSAAPAARKPSAVAQSGKKPNRTYGRAANAASDKENEGDDFEPADDGDGTDLPEVSLHEVTGSKELEVAKRKFAEVDEWDMEFESMSVEDHRSSSQQWR
ncbi:hypothetical protein LTR85_007409 [Meristemomyces frigidus]|nr:hypothetical protein LTR85_007409 [Meristemomyces frigidus]